MLNRRRLRSRSVHAAGYDILNDPTPDWTLLTYFILPEDQRRQLADCGLALRSCRTLDGAEIDLAHPPADRVELTYTATPDPAGGALHSATALRP